MKTIKHFLLTVAVLLCNISANAHDFEVDGIYYNITSEEDLTVAVTFKGENIYDFSDRYTGSVNIPKTVTHNSIIYNVTSIGESAFYNCSGLTSVIIPNSVTSIGNSAFSSCYGLKEVNISDIATWCNIEFWDENSNPLKYAHHLYLYTAYPEHAVDLGLPSGTLWADRNIGADSPEDYGDYFSWGETEPKSFYNWSTYKWCNGEYGTFTKYCTDSSLGTVDNKTTLDSTDDAAIVNWGDKWGMPTYEQLLELESKCTWTWITQDNVNGYKVKGPNGKSIFLPATGRRSENSLDYAGSSGFYWSSSLCEDYIGNSAWLLGFGPENRFFDYGRSTGYPIRAVNSVKASKEEVKDLIIPEGVTAIKDYAFFGCSGLTSIEIPNSVTSIGSYAFYHCHRLTSVSIPNNVTSIEEYTFVGCEGLTSVTIPNSVNSIGDYAFSCSGLTSMTIPNSVTSIGNNAFYGCLNLVSIEIGDGITYFGYCVFDNTPWYEKQPDGVIYINNLLYAYKGDMPDNTSVVIKDGTACIAGNAFWNLTGLTSVTIPNSVTSICEEAFYGCSGLTSVTIPNSVTSIGDYAFSSCSGLISMTIPNSVTSIGRYGVFSGCSGLTSVTIGNSVTSIGYNAFENCSSLTSVTIPNTVTSIENYAFYGCSGLTSVTIPNSVTSIGGYAFEECPNLTEATVGCKWKENPVYTFDPNVTVNATLHSYTDGICTECGHSDPSSPTVIIDGAVTEYSVAVERACPITYTRTFNNTEWQALYVPFAMSYDDWKEDFDVAKINDIHQFDVNNDGDFDDAEDKTIMEMLKVNNGTLKANHPYMIRAKSTGEKSITIENATLMPTEVNSIDCSSVERKYVFTGTYNTIDGVTMVNNKYYAMSGGGVKYTTSTSVSLKPFRWYMQIMDRDGQLLESAAEIKVVVSGEDDWDMTGIESVKDGDGTFKVYSIGGVLVRSVKAADIKQATEGLPKGLYIINGKKCNVR